MRAAIFIEPAGILTNINLERRHSGRFYDLLAAATEPLASLKNAGYLLIANTNEHGLLQAGVARSDLDRLHGALRQEFGLDDILVCRHEDADSCPCRKPRAGLLTEAAFKWHLDLDRSFVVGNRWQDAEMARIVGCVSLLVKSPWIGRGHHDFVLPDLASVAEKILDLKDGTHAILGGSAALP
jgi:D-glycero-D-manno-heptose 1,7-bisphosphate phosphatase